MSSYYTPELEEFHVGFEYEQYLDFDKAKYLAWHKIIFDGDEFNYETSFFPLDNNFDEKVRVKFLDSDDIINLGFVDIGSGWYEYEKESGFRLRKWKDHELDIWYDYNYWNGEEDRELRFRGVIKNKSELNVLMKQLKMIQ